MSPPTKKAHDKIGRASSSKGVYALHFALPNFKQFVSCSSPPLLFCCAADALTICAPAMKNAIVVTKMLRVE